MKLVVVAWKDDRFVIERKVVVPHECRTREVFLQEVGKLDRFPYQHFCVTGRKFKDTVDGPTITEPEATEHALKHWLRVRDTT